jgi:protein phosphatase
MKIIVPEFSLVLLVGASGSGKSTFARAHFKATEVVSSDRCRALVSDDEADQSATQDAFEILHLIAAKRLARGRLTVIDATNVEPQARRSLLALAHEHQAAPVAIVLDLPEQIAHERNWQRPGRVVAPHIVRQQQQDLRRSLAGLEGEGFRQVYVLSSPEQVAAATVERRPAQ